MGKHAVSGGVDTGTLGRPPGLGLESLNCVGSFHKLSHKLFLCY